MATVAIRDLPAAERRLPPAWPLLAMYALFPVWWALGLGEFVWPLLALPMLFALLLRRHVLMPLGFGIWAAFIGWMLISGLELDSADRAIGFAYRSSIYLAATVVLLYVFNTTEDELPVRRVANVLTGFWLFVVVGGYLAILFPAASFSTPFEAMLPRALATNPFVAELVHPSFAQVHDFLGYPVPRPAAPFVYTNDWGSMFGLLLPFVLVSFLRSRSDLWRLVLLVAAVASLVPLVVSLDRGLWLSAGVGLIYAMLRLGAAGRGRAFGAVAVLLPVAVGILWFTPLHQLISDRFAHPHSNERRLELYQESVDSVRRSPLLGFGAPRPSDISSTAPAVGTQGQLWLVLFSHGFPGLILFVAWFATAWWKTRGTDPPDAFLAHLVLLVAFVQMPFYGWIPAQLVLLMVAAGLGLRAVRDRAGLEPVATVPLWA
jgi:hypothetical protein